MDPSLFVLTPDLGPNMVRGVVDIARFVSQCSATNSEGLCYRQNTPLVLSPSRAALHDKAK